MAARSLRGGSAAPETGGNRFVGRAGRRPRGFALSRFVAPAGPQQGAVRLLGDTAEARGLAEALSAAGWREVDPAGSREASFEASLQAGLEGVIDAAHPFAADLAATAPDLVAQLIAQGRYLRLRRAPWRPEAGDDWRCAADPSAARRVLAPEHRRVLITLGRDRLAPFRNDRGRRYWIRARGAAAAAAAAEAARWREATLLTEVGPFSTEEEERLLARLAIDVLVARNDGGVGARPKIDAARALGLPVVLVRRPPEAPLLAATPEVTVETIAAAAARLADGFGAAKGRRPPLTR